MPIANNQKLLSLFCMSKAAIKIIMATEGQGDIWWKDHLHQLVDPQNYRPVHHHLTDVSDTKHYNPLTGLEEDYVRDHERGAS